MKSHSETRSPPALGCSDSAQASVRTSPTELFEYLDDPRHLGAHMTRSSWMLAGGNMAYKLDSREGRGAGAHIRMTGRILGMEIFLDEVVDAYEPPVLKAWHTVGEPRLLVIGHYRMGFETRPAAEGSVLRVFIDWAPVGKWPRAMSRWLGKRYARWCVQSMTRDARRRFAPPGVR